MVGTQWPLRRHDIGSCSRVDPRCRHQGALGPVAGGWRSRRRRSAPRRGAQLAARREMNRHAHRDVPGPVEQAPGGGGEKGARVVHPPDVDVHGRRRGVRQPDLVGEADRAPPRWHLVSRNKTGDGPLPRKPYSVVRDRTGHSRRPRPSGAVPVACRPRPEHGGVVPTPSCSREISQPL